VASREQGGAPWYWRDRGDGAWGIASAQSCQSDGGHMHSLVWRNHQANGGDTVLTFMKPQSDVGDRACMEKHRLWALGSFQAHRGPSV
jgi:hypothetical protein